MTALNKRLLLTALSKKKYLACGKRGIAYTSMLGEKLVLVKERNPDADVDTIAHEAETLIVVNAVNVGPIFIALEGGALVREFIDGPEFLDWAKTHDKQPIKRALIDVLEQCRRLDVIGVNKFEMNHPHKHILMRGGGGSAKPVMIDFDRSRRVVRPKNVTQVCQWITGGTMLSFLAEKGVMLDRGAVLRHAKSYKTAYSKAHYEHIIEMIRHA